MERIAWAPESHERQVERFYGQGTENYGEFHDGYLNFGLWEPGIDGYLQAAENLIQRIGTMLGLGPKSHLLDVAPGMGTQDVYLLRRFKPTRIDAVDVTWKHVEHCRRRARDARLEDAFHVHHGSAVSLPFSDNTFTHAMSIEGPEHFDTRERFFREAFRVLAPGGVMAISDYTLKREPRNVFERLVIQAACRLWKVPAANVYGVQGYRERLEKSGFKNVSIEEVGSKVIPGYYFEQIRPECRRELARIRGFVAGRLGIIIDVVVYRAFTMGLIEYILVRAEKP